MTCAKCKNVDLFLLKSNKWKNQKLDAKEVNKNEQTLANYRPVHKHETKTPPGNEFARLLKGQNLKALNTIKSD